MRPFGIATQFQSTYLNYIFINRPWFQILDIGMQPVIRKCHVLSFFKFTFLLSWSLKNERRNIQIKIITGLSHSFHGKKCLQNFQSSSFAQTLFKNIMNTRFYFMVNIIFRLKDN